MIMCGISILHRYYFNCDMNNKGTPLLLKCLDICAVWYRFNVNFPNLHYYIEILINVILTTKWTPLLLKLKILNICVAWTSFNVYLPKFPLLHR